MNSQSDEILKEMEECSFPRWYENFEKNAIPGMALRIPSEVFKYLRDEIVVLPKECYQSENRESIIEFSTDLSDLNVESDGYESDDAVIVQPEFPEFSRQIKKIIDRLPDHAAFLKTKWHCPKDSFWITAGQTLKVKDITDVYQLLKASSIVKQDISDSGLPDNWSESTTEKIRPAVNNCEHFIVLKEWHEIHPGTEFRCFVRQRNLIAISPRDWPAYHQFIVEQKREICSDIVSLFKEKIKTRFPLENFVFDVVRVRKDFVLIVDFSPFNEKLTESLAFEWNELNDEHAFQEDDDPDFRYLLTDCGIQPSKRNNYGIPIDIVKMFSENNATENCIDNMSLLFSQIQNHNQRH